MGWMLGLKQIGSTVHVGGLLRLDVVEAPSESIYVTVWASAQLPCHMGKSEKAEELFEKHLGDRLKVCLSFLFYSDR